MTVGHWWPLKAITIKSNTKPGRATVLCPSKDIPKGTVMSIYRQAGWRRYRKQQMHYQAFIHQDANGFGVSFPDFPGCIAQGDTLDAALQSAREALAFHVEGMKEDDARVPTLRSADEIMVDTTLAEWREGAKMRGQVGFKQTPGGAERAMGRDMKRFKVKMRRRCMRGDPH